MKKIRIILALTITVFSTILLVGCLNKEKDFSELLNNIKIDYGNNIDQNNIKESFTLVNEVSKEEIEWISDSDSLIVNNNKVEVKQLQEEQKVSLTASFKNDLNKNKKVFNLTILKDETFGDTFDITYGTNLSNEYLKNDFVLPDTYKGYKVTYSIEENQNFIITDNYNVTINRAEENVNLVLKVNIDAINYVKTYEVPITIVEIKLIQINYIDENGLEIFQELVEKGIVIDSPFFSNEVISFDYYKDPFYTQKIDQLIFSENTDIYVKSSLNNIKQAFDNDPTVNFSEDIYSDSLQVYINENLIDSTAENIFIISDMNKNDEDFKLVIKNNNGDVILEKEISIWKQPSLVTFEEKEGFIPSSTYNNEKPRITGEETYQWEIVYGTVTSTKTQVINDIASLQMRTYDRTHVTPYALTKFSIAELNKVEFYAKTSAKNNLKVSYSKDGKNFTNEVDYTLSKNPTKYIYELDTKEAVYIKFEVIKDGVGNVTIDNVLFDHNRDKRIVFMSDEPEKGGLEEIKERFEDERKVTNKLSDLAPYDNLTYYASLNGLSKEAFKAELSKILTDTMTPRSYGEARFILEQSDYIKKDDKTYLYGAYDNALISVIYWDGGTSWAREHVWPNSRLGIERVENGTRNQGTDLYNLRAIVPSTNSSRSNRYFENPEEKNTKNQTVGRNAYYTGDDQRGDTARILFYMATRYHNILTLVNEVLTNDSSTNYKPQGAKMSMLDTLLAWHKEDPVSEFEVQRNNVIYEYQGNRNPYVDNPGYVEQYFYKEISQNQQLTQVYKEFVFNPLSKFDKAIIFKNDDLNINL